MSCPLVKQGWKHEEGAVTGWSWETKVEGSRLWAAPLQAAEFERVSVCSCEGWEEPAAIRAGRQTRRARPEGLLSSPGLPACVTRVRDCRAQEQKGLIPGNSWQAAEQKLSGVWTVPDCRRICVLKKEENTILGSEKYWLFGGSTRLLVKMKLDVFSSRRMWSTVPCCVVMTYINELIRSLFPPLPLLQGLHQLLRHECCQRGLERLHLCVELSRLSEEAVPGPPLTLPCSRDHGTNGPVLHFVHSHRLMAPC